MSSAPGSILPSFGSKNYDCWVELNFNHWSQIFVVVGLSYLWNLGLILWTLPWNVNKEDIDIDNKSTNDNNKEKKDENNNNNNNNNYYIFPYLGSTLSVMFESSKYGISIQNWRQLGKKRIDENNIFNIVQSTSFKFFIFIFTLNSWILFISKITMFLTFKSSFYYAWNERGFTDFFNIEIALITLLMISNIFFSFPILPSFQIASTKSSFILCCLYLLYIEIILTFILLCIQYPLLISVLYIGACIILTGMILGMAILCLLSIVILSGSIIFWTLNILTLFKFNKKQILRSFSASITWLFITYLVWVSGICLSFLFTTSQFQSILCINPTQNIYQLISFIFVSLSIIISILSLIILKFVIPINKNNNNDYQYSKVQNFEETEI